MRAYASLLCLYPRTYREQFAEEMLQVFGEVRAAMAREGALSRLSFYFSEFRGLLWGAASEHLRALGAPHGFEFFGKRSLYMQPERRFSKTAIVFMTLVLGVIVEIIAKGQGISRYIVQEYTVNGHTVVEMRKNIELGHSISEWPSSYGLLSGIAVGFLIAFFCGLIAWSVAHALRRSGVHRLDEAQTWPQSR